MSNEMVAWPYRYRHVASKGYVVWRDVFEGRMQCTIEDAVETHRVAVFVIESEAADYCDYRNHVRPALLTWCRGCNDEI